MNQGKSSRWLAACGAVFWLGGSVAVAATHSIEATTLNYDIDAALTYIDALQHLPGKIATEPLAAASADAAATSDNQPRTMGLRRLRLDLAWQASRSTGLRIVLRPDAANRGLEAGPGVPPREFDARSGDPGMQPMPTIRLLDAYQLTLAAGAELSFGAGVWEGFDHDVRAYPEQLGFGLGVLFPAKFSGVRINWQLPNAALDTAAAAGPGALAPVFGVRAYLFEGDEDRAEGQLEKHGAYDTAPSARDPYHGGAVVFSWRLRPELTLGALVGYLDEADDAGSYDAVFGQLNTEVAWQIAGRSLNLAFDARYEHSHGRDGVADQTLISGTMTGMVGLSEQLWGLCGASYGKASRWAAFATQRMSTVGLQGYQLEGGLRRQEGSHLSLQLLLSHEYRTLHAAGVQSGGFQDAGGSQATIHRLGVELTYLLNQNA